MLEILTRVNDEPIDFWNGETVSRSESIIQIEYWAAYMNSNDDFGVWSIFAPKMNGTTPHPLGEDARIRYTNFDKNRESESRVRGDTVGDVVDAASRLLAISDETHHTFIEAFERPENWTVEDGNIWEMITGS